MKTYHTIDTAVAMARLMRQTNRRHYVVKQHRHGQYTVQESRSTDRPAWTTHNDQRSFAKSRIRKIEISDIPLILGLISENITLSEIARKFDVGRTAIRDIRDKYS